MTLPAPFGIVASWTPRRHPRAYEDAEYRLWDRESRSLFAFVARYEGPLTLRFPKVTINLDLDDLPMVFDTLDAVTDALSAEGGRAQMYFAGLGTDLRLELRRSGSTVVVTLHAGLTAPPEFRSLDGREIAVDADSFVREWLDLRDRVRAAFADLP